MGIDLEGRMLKISRTKNGDPITLALNPNAMRAISIFRLWGNGSGRVLRNVRGEPLKSMISGGTIAGTPSPAACGKRAWILQPSQNYWDSPKSGFAKT